MYINPNTHTHTSQQTIRSFARLVHGVLMWMVSISPLSFILYIIIVSFEMKLYLLAMPVKRVPVAHLLVREFDGVQSRIRTFHILLLRITFNCWPFFYRGFCWDLSLSIAICSLKVQICCFCHGDPSAIKLLLIGDPCGRLFTWSLDVNHSGKYKYTKLKKSYDELILD